VKSRRTLLQEVVQAVLDQEEEAAKAEVLDLLVRPYEELARLFMEAFENYRPKLKRAEWGCDTIEICFFTKYPTSDALRNIIFSLYDIVWGGKPTGLECVYRGLLGAEATGRDVELIILTSPKSLSQIIRGARTYWVLDDKEYSLWKEIKNQHREANRLKRIDELKRSGHIFDPGQPIPVFKHGFFKV
jgi:hypothetical protein